MAARRVDPRASGASQGEAALPIEAWVREILACPACHGPLSDGDGELICEACALAYPVVDGIAVLLASDARPVAAGR